MFEFWDHVWPAITLTNKDLGCSFSVSQINVLQATKVLSFVTARWLLPNLQVVNFAHFFEETEIYKLNFLEIVCWNFSEIFRDYRGVDCLSMYKFVGSYHLRKKVSKIFPKIFFGGSSLPGGTKISKKCYGGSTGIVEQYITLKRS